MQICKYNIRETLPKSTYEDIKNLFEIFNQQNIQIFARDGFLLGVIRHKGFLPFDIDPDVGILSDDYNKLKTIKLPEKYCIKYQHNPRNIKYILKHGVPYEFNIKKSDSKHKNFLILLYIITIFLVVIILLLHINTLSKIILIIIVFIVTEVTRELSYSRLTTILDGTIFQTHDQEEYYQEIEPGEIKVAKEEYNISSKYFTYKKNDVKPLRKSEFYNSYVFVPKNSEYILKKHYGDNVFDVMFKKEDKNLDKIDIRYCIPPPANLETY